MIYDVFISYRREGGGPTARLLRTELERRGYRVFIDVEDLPQGHYDEALLMHIESARGFLIVLSPGALERCSSEKDWIRVEIAHAIKTKRKVVPLLMPHFEFPPLENLPVEIQSLPRHQSVVYSNEHFASTLEKTTKLLGSPMSARARIVKKTILWAAVALLIFGGGSMLWNSASDEVAAQDSRIQKQGQEKAVGALLEDVFSNLAHLDIRLQAVEQFVDAALAQKEETLPKIRRDALEKYLNDLRVQFNGDPVVKSFGSTLNSLVVDSGLPPDAVRRVYEQFEEVDHATDQLLSTFADWAKEENVAQQDFRRKWVIVERDRLRARAQSAYLAGMRLLIKTPQEMRGPTIERLPLFHKLEPNRFVSAEDIVSYEQRNLAQAQVVAMQRAELVKQYSEKLNDAQGRLNSVTAGLDIQPTDTPDDIAIKAWKCRLLGYRSKAFTLLGEYIKRFPDVNAPERKYAETAQAFFAAAQEEKIKDAWYVTAVEKIPNGAPCALLEGDIVIQLNGKPVETAKAFFDYLKDHPGETAQIDLMRRSENGRFEKKQVPFKKDRKIGLMGI